MSSAAKEQNWPYNWAWGSSVTDSGTVYLAVPYENYASMAPPERSFMDVLAKHFKSEKEAKKIMEEWTSHLESTSYNVYRLVN